MVRCFSAKHDWTPQSPCLIKGALMKSRAVPDDQDCRRIDRLQGCTHLFGRHRAIAAPRISTRHSEEPRFVTGKQISPPGNLSAELTIDVPAQAIVSAVDYSDFHCETLAQCPVHWGVILN